MHKLSNKTSEFEGKIIDLVTKSNEYYEHISFFCKRPPNDRFLRIVCLRKGEKTICLLHAV